MDEHTTLTMPCTECGAHPIVNSYGAHRTPRFFYMCSQCENLTYGASLSKVDARRLWNVNNIDVDACGGE